MVERVEPTVRYVAVDGLLSRIEPGTADRLVELTSATSRRTRSTPTLSPPVASMARAWLSS
jgi:hypothetical protein